MIVHSISRPLLYLFTEPIVAAISIWVGFVWGCVFLFANTVSGVFAGAFGFSVGASGAVLLWVALALPAPRRHPRAARSLASRADPPRRAFLSPPPPRSTIAISGSIGMVFDAVVQNRLYERARKRSPNGRAEPEARLISATVVRCAPRAVLSGSSAGLADLLRPSFSRAHLCSRLPSSFSPGPGRPRCPGPSRSSRSASRTSAPSSSTQVRVSSPLTLPPPNADSPTTKASSTTWRTPTSAGRRRPRRASLH